MEHDIKKIILHTEDSTENAKTPAAVTSGKSFAGKPYRKVVDFMVFKVAPVIISVIAIIISCL